MADTTQELDFEFQSRFEEDEETIKEKLLESGSLEDYRKEPGDYVYDVVVPQAPMIQQQQANMDEVLRNAFTLYAEDEYLDMKVIEADLERTPAQPAQGVLIVGASAGVIIPAGHELSCTVIDEDGNPITATVNEEVPFNEAGALSIDITTEGTGDIMNVPPGSSWFFSPPIAGVESITQPGRLIGGADREDDESLRNKWKAKKHKPVRSGNKHHYVTWALEVPGVGAAKTVPLWAGRNTVKVIIADTEGQPATPQLVTNVQMYIDPSQDGMGEGVAPVGAIVTVESVANLAINIAAGITLIAGSTLEEAAAAFRIDLDAYLDTLAAQVMDSNRKEPIVIVYNKLTGLLSMNPHVEDYTNFTVNSGTANITLLANEVPSSGTITLT
ncbi:baseplate J/gp47 family protein [Metabacillus fastidiosus]|uniref:baseplate J/gp47 family protein n=1 Tax=Metabacillus fastidiosus TaxID=1458 RepID=UPI003D2CB818